MRVRTIRTHSNEFGASYEKLGSAGAIYEVTDDVGKRLIKAGYVEKADGGNARAKGTGSGAGSPAKSDG